ncbi:MAG: glycosyltransferase family 2 protein [Proteobacteria bacterium]|nr:glycosyltransferase family 2 protein [Pseudomonadota bacterium]
MAANDNWIPPDRSRPTGSERPPLSLTIPLYDEEGNVQRVVRDLLDAFGKADVPFTLILVDNGSRDGTRAIVQRLEAEHDAVRGVYLDKNQGYGGGILAGMETADTPLLGYMWGDAQVGADDVLRVYRRLVADDVDVAKARRVQRMDGWQRTVVTRVYNTAALWLFHVTSTDANGCPKIFTRDAWNQLGPPKSADWFLDPEIMIGVAEQVMKLAEVDVLARARDFGVSKVGVGTVIEFAINMLRRRAGGR